MTSKAATKQKCREQIMDGYTLRSCTRNAARDGYCNQHHPDTIKARQKESEKRFQAKREKDPLYVARRRAQELEQVSKNLVAAAEEMLQRSTLSPAWRQLDEAVHEARQRM